MKSSPYNYRNKGVCSYLHYGLLQSVARLSQFSKTLLPSHCRQKLAYMWFYAPVKCYSITTKENTVMNVQLTCTAASVRAMKVWSGLRHRLLRTNVPITSHGYGDVADWRTSPRAPWLHRYILFYNASATTITPYSTHRLACSSLLRLGILWYYCDGRIILEWKHTANFCYISCPIDCSDVALWKDG